MIRRRIGTAFALLVLVPVVLVGAGCAKKPAVAVEEPVVQKETPPPPPPKATETPTVDPNVWKSEIRDVFFDYDKYEIRSDARAVLQENARLLKANAGAALVLEGHCDERGTPEYNLALGQRRADAVAAYLKDLGVNASAVQTVSYGEEKPFAQGNDETAWSQNRRAHFRFQ